MRAFRLPLLASLAAALPGQHFENNRPADPKWFPLAVWLQSPHNAERYRDIGINLYVGLYDGPTKPQLDALERAKMPAICHQNDVGLAYRGDVIVGWMHGDEPDNAQAGKGHDGYDPPIPPADVVAELERMKRADDTRPVLLNLGQGVAWDGWYGRGPRTNHPEDYPEYVKGGDIVSFDIYPVVHKHADVKGKLEFVGRGVSRLRECTRGQKPIWACIETGHIDNADVRPTPQQVRTEVWMAIACGADGIVYFAHEFAPAFVEAGLLAHDDVRDGVKALNAEVLAFAEVLNSARAEGAVKATGKAKGEFAVRAHEHGGALWLFVASLSVDETELRLELRDKQRKRLEVLGGKESRRLRDGTIRDELEPYGIRHYKVTR
jgi:hypothetical protein